MVAQIQNPVDGAIHIDILNLVGTYSMKCAEFLIISLNTFSSTPFVVTTVQNIDVAVKYVQYLGSIVHILFLASNSRVRNSGKLIV